MKYDENTISIKMNIDHKPLTLGVLKAIIKHVGDFVDDDAVLIIPRSSDGGDIARKLGDKEIDQEIRVFKIVERTRDNIQHIVQAITRNRTKDRLMMNEIILDVTDDIKVISVTTNERY